MTLNAADVNWGLSLLDAVESSDLKPSIYLRYIDDIFGIWTHGPDYLDSFFEDINHFHPALKLSLERSDHTDNRKIRFLDTLIRIERNGVITSGLFIKPMAAPIILPYKSSHPIQTKRSVLYAQLLRAKRLRSSSAAQERDINKVE